PEQVPAVTEPRGALAPAEPGGQALHRGAADPVLVEARVENLDRGVGHAHWVLHMGRQSSTVARCFAGAPPGVFSGPFPTGEETPRMHHPRLLASLAVLLVLTLTAVAPAPAQSPRKGGSLKVGM